MIKLQLLFRNPLSLQVLLAEYYGFFKHYNVDVDMELIDYFPAFDMSNVNANVGDTTRIFERLNNGENLIITADLSRTMKLILKDDYKKDKPLNILVSKEQSLGIYNDYFFKSNNMDYIPHESKGIEQRIKLLKNQEVDGAFMIAPFLEQFIGNGYSVVYEGIDHFDNYTCWAFKKEYVDNNRDNVLNFHLAINDAIVKFNKLSASEKLHISKKLLNIDSSLYEFYSNLSFELSKEYSIKTLDRVQKYKNELEGNIYNYDLEGLVLKWNL